MVSKGTYGRKAKRSFGLKQIATVLIFFMVLASVVGCAKQKEERISPDKQIQKDVEKQSDDKKEDSADTEQSEEEYYDIVTDQSVTAGTEIANLPLYPGSANVTYNKFGVKDEDAFNIKIEYVANGDREKVLSWYGDQLNSLGWEVSLIEMNDDSEPGGRSKQIEGAKGSAAVHIFFEKSTATATPVRLTFNTASE